MAKSYRVIGLTDRNFFAVTAIETGMVDRNEGIKSLEQRNPFSYSEIKNFISMTSETFDISLIEKLIDSKALETLYSMTAPSDLVAYMYHKGIASSKVKCTHRLTSRPYFSGDLVISEEDDRYTILVPAGLGVKEHKVKRSALRF